MRVVLAAATSSLRDAIARGVPEASPAVDVPQVLAAVRAARPDWPHDEIADVLGALEEARFTPGGIPRCRGPRHLGRGPSRRNSTEGGRVSFARPLLLLLLLAPAALVVAAPQAARHRRRSATWAWWRRTRGRPGGRGFRRCCARWRSSPGSSAAAGPQVGGSTVEEKREGIAIAIAIDISSSMLAEDFAPSNRLEVAKQQAIEFVRGRKADRIGLVAFAGEALTQVPVTLDYAVVVQAIEGLRIGSLEDGTAIGSGLATAVNRLRRAPGKSKVVLLLTDGENNRGRIDPRTAAATAEAYGIKVYTIGVGTDGEARIPTGRGIGGLRYEVLPGQHRRGPAAGDRRARPAASTSAPRDSEALSRIFHQIDALEKTPVTVTRYARYDEVIQPFVIAGLVALLLELALLGHGRGARAMTFETPLLLAAAPILGGCCWPARGLRAGAGVRAATAWSVALGTSARAARAGRRRSWRSAGASRRSPSPGRGAGRAVSCRRAGRSTWSSRWTSAARCSPRTWRRAGCSGPCARRSRLVEDLPGDRLGLIAFAGKSYILSPLTVDGGAVEMYLDALDPDIASEGGTNLSAVLRQGSELLDSDARWRRPGAGGVHRRRGPRLAGRCAGGGTRRWPGRASR